MGRFLLSLIFICIALQPAIAAEVSEVTVDFPLSEILDLAPAGVTDDKTDNRAEPEVVVPRASWEEEWFTYRQKSLRGNQAGAVKHLDNINNYRLKAGIPNLFIPTAALLFESSQARKQARYDDALQLINYASKLSPDDPSPHFYRARTLWKQSNFRVLSSMDAVLEGWVAFVRDFRSVFPWMFGFLTWILTGIIVACIVSIFLYAVRVIPRIAHDISHLIHIPQWVIYLAVPVVMGVLLLTWFPFIWWIVAIAFIAFFHATVRERIALTACLVLLVCVPLLVHVMALGNSFSSGSREITLYTAEMAGQGEKIVRELETLRTKYPQDADVLVAMAAVLKRDGNLVGAETMLKKASILNPESAVVTNNLANIMLARGKIENSVDQYKKALRHSDDVLIHYNLSLALHENLQLEEGGREFQKAQSMDPDLIGKITSNRGEGGESYVLDIYTDKKTYYFSALKLDDMSRQWRNTLWGGVLPWISFSVSLIAFPIAGVLMLAGWPLSKALFSSSRCRRCGRLHCVKCSESSKDDLCSQCRQIFYVRTGVDPASRVRKMMQIMRFNRRRTLAARILTVILPGSGHASVGEGIKAVVLIMISAIFWLKWILWHGLFRSTTMLEIQPGMFMRIIFAVFFLVYYIFVFRSLGKIMEDK